ncbi:enoyl-CoA hydratase/isomerase family protein, partial [mine drainage metagenome]
RNAMNPAFFEEFPLAIKELVKDGQVRAIVISSSGNDFTVGLDLKESILHSPGGSVAKSASIMYERVKALQDSFSVLENTSIPVIAAISGYCIGGGVDLIAACDIRIASADAIFSIREAKIAIVADLGSLQRLPSIIPRGHLYELALTAEDFGADRALEINLINRILPTKEEVIEAAFEVAK